MVGLPMRRRTWPPALLKRCLCDTCVTSHARRCTSYQAGFTRELVLGPTSAGSELEALKRNVSRGWLSSRLTSAKFLHGWLFRARQPHSQAHFGGHASANPPLSALHVATK